MKNSGRILWLLVLAGIGGPTGWLRAAESITLAGHDEALVAVMHRWAGDYAKRHAGAPAPTVKELPAPVAGQGTLDDPTAPPLAPTLLRFGPTAWTISARERVEYVAARGRPPLDLCVGFGAVASKGKPHAIGVYVHPENPLRRLTLAQIDAVFSAERRRGHAEVKTWGDLGLTGEWAGQPVHAVGRRRNNTVAASFRELVLLDGEYHPGYREMADSNAAVAAVAGDRLALGFFGYGFATPAVRAIAVAEKTGAPYAELTEASVAAGHYPLRRDFRVLVDWPADPAKVPAEVRRFLRYLFTPEAQAILVAEGFNALPPAVLAAERARIE